MSLKSFYISQYFCIHPMTSCLWSQIFFDLVNDQAARARLLPLNFVMLYFSLSHIVCSKNPGWCLRNAKLSAKAIVFGVQSRALSIPQIWLSFEVFIDPWNERYLRPSSGRGSVGQFLGQQSSRQFKNPIRTEFSLRVGKLWVIFRMVTLMPETMEYEIRVAFGCMCNWFISKLCTINKFYYALSWLLCSIFLFKFEKRWLGGQHT